jgi:hypothetical protein
LISPAIHPRGYSVKVHNQAWSNARFIRSWRFEGSTDGDTWESLDSHTDSSELNSNDKEVSFEISSQPKSSPGFRFVRFLMVGTNSSNYHEFSLQRFEVFGELLNTK